MTVTICLNAIVKDEEAGILDMLKSVTKSIHYYVIVDTGSTDRTKEVIKEYFDSVGIKGEIHDRPWYNDFGRSRTEALELCVGKSDYVYISDATDALKGDIVLKDKSMDGYKMLIEHAGTKYWRVQLVKNDPSLGWKYHGVLHEYLGCSKPGHKVSNLDGCSILYNVSPSVRDKNPNKYKDDAAVLEKALEKEPDNERYQFYLAQSYRDAGMFKESIEAYKRRIAMGKWHEEVYNSYYNVGLCLIHLNASDQEIIDAFMDAFNHSKHRAEPMYQLAKYFREKRQFDKGYKYGMLAVDLKYPEQDILFVHNYIYQYALKDEVAICAYYVGEHNKAIELNADIYNKVPDYMKDRVKKNCQYSLDALKYGYVKALNTIAHHRML